MEASATPSGEADRQPDVSGPQRIVVLVSGVGSNLQAILDACRSGTLLAEVAAVVSNKADVFALQRAAAEGVPAVHVGIQTNKSREEYDARLADVVAGFGPDVVVLAGWMRLLTTSFLGWFPERVINLHPALPGTFPGTRAIERAWSASANGTCDRSGVMVHLVPDAGVDDGPVLATSTIDIKSFETFEEFEESVHAVERQLLVDTLIKLCCQSTSELASDYRQLQTCDQQSPYDRKEISA